MIGIFRALRWSLQHRHALPANAMIIERHELYAVWEQTHLSRLLEHLKVDGVLDVGANEGQYGEMLRKKAGYTGYIFSFEPIPDTVAVLRERAKGDEKWIVSDSAIAEVDGTQPFNVMQHSQFSSFSAPRHDEIRLFLERNENVVKTVIDVRTERLETALKRLKNTYGCQRPFLKMDTQGFDVRIVKSSRAVMHEFVGLQSELAIAKLYSDSVGYREALSEYEACGFALSAFVPNNSGHFPQLVETDCIMVRSDLIKPA